MNFRKSKAIDPSQYKSHLLKVVSIPIISMAILAIILGIQFQKLYESFGRVDQTDQEIAQIHKTQRLLIQMESGVRGFLLAADSKFLDSYNGALTAYPIALQQLRTLIADNPEQLAKLATLERLRLEWMAYSEKAMGALPKIDSGTSRLLHLRGKELMDRIYSQFDRIISTENVLKIERNKKSGDQFQGRPV